MAKKRILVEMDKLISFVSDDRVAKLYVSTAYQRITNMIIKMAACNCACNGRHIINEKDIRRAAIDYRASFITAMAFFTNFVTSVRTSKQRMYDLMRIISNMWATSETRGIIYIKDLYEELKNDKRWNISERSIRNLLSSMEKARLLKYDRGVGPKPGIIIDISEFSDDDFYKWLRFTL